MPTHIMTDIETGAKGAGAAITQIAAAVFDPFTGATGDRFYTTVDMRDCQARGLRVDADTVMWLMKLPDDARKRMIEATGDLPKALSDYFNWVASHSQRPIMWANDPDFDYVILESAAFVCGYKESELPWKFWDKMACRTIMTLCRLTMGLDMRKRTPFQGIPHFAPDDVTYQCQYVAAALRTMGLRARDAMANVVQQQAALQGNFPVLGAMPNLPPLPGGEFSPVIECE